MLEKKEKVGDGDFFDKLQAITEKYLTRRRRIRRIKKAKQKAKNPVLDWIEAFLWAAGVVLLINQYLFQAYEIPSGSMIDTLLIRDRIFVNKLIFGPEILPGVGKLPSPIRPQRNDVIIFENPTYISRGPVFDIAQRIIYMLTLSLVDINRDERGEPRAQFLIKRAVGWNGDHFVKENGDFRIRFAGETRWASEEEFNYGRNFSHRIIRLTEPASYPALLASGRASAYIELGINPPAALASTASSANFLRFPDPIAHDRARLEVLRAAHPQNRRYGVLLSRHVLGWYVPEGWMLTLGDNRDNSRDGRYYGPIRESKVLGKGFVIYWPRERLGFIR